MIPAAAEDIDPNTVSPGALGFFTLLFLLVAAFILFRSLRKQLNKVDFDEAAEAEAEPEPQTKNEQP